MPFDTTQNSYVSLRKVLAERTRQIVVVCGAGLSRTAGMPSWDGLRSKLVQDARKIIEYRSDNIKRDEALTDAAEAENDYWVSFKLLKKVLGDTTYAAEIRNAFSNAAAENPPIEYTALWTLPINGFVTLNVDGFCSRAFAEVYGGKKPLTELSGMDFVNGPNLQEAIEAKKITTWAERLKVAIALVQIIKAAHLVPEAVLHRDIRPANIMLCDLWSDPQDYQVVVLDFDLSWHRDAVGHSVSLAHSVNGYLAPELAARSKTSSRNALVDSYGIGMTLFYLATGRAPLFGESHYDNWSDKLRAEIGKQISNDWHSLSTRWMRLVFWATKPEQSERWDIRLTGSLSVSRLQSGGAINRAVEGLNTAIECLKLGNL